MFKRTVATGLLFALVIGCGGPSNPPTEKVTGTVTLDGKPVERATVTMLPDDSANQAAVGQTDADGNFEMTTFVSGDGAMVGSYKIQVHKYEMDEGVSPYGEAPVSDAPSEPMSEEEEMAMMEKGYAASQAERAKEMRQGAKSRGGPKHELPPKYAKVATSGLTHTVVEGTNTLNLELKSK